MLSTDFSDFNGLRCCPWPLLLAALLAIYFPKRRVNAAGNPRPAKRRRTGLPPPGSERQSDQATDPTGSNSAEQQVPDSQEPADPPPPEPPPEPPPVEEEPTPASRDRTKICLATWNIQNGRASRLEQALRAMDLMGVDVGFLQETKLTNGVYTRRSSGYNVFATEASSHSQGGVALFYRSSSTHWQIESECAHGPNVISCFLVTGRKRIPLVGVYIPPNDQSTLEHVHRAFNRFPAGSKPLLLGDLNINLANPRDDREVVIAAAMANHGLSSMLDSFLQRKRLGSRATWFQLRNGEFYSEQLDYVLGTDRRQLQNVAIRRPRHFASDHLVVTASLRSASRKENFAYLRGRRRYPLRPPKGGPLSKAETLFATLKDAIPSPTRAEMRRRSWISQETWALVDEYAGLRRDRPHERSRLRRLSRRIRRSLHQDRKARTEKAGDAIEEAMRNGNLKESWGKLKAWYRHAERAPKPARVDLQRITETWGTLYEQQDPPGDPVPVLVAPFDVRDDVPNADEIAAAVRRLRSGRAPGPSKMRPDHFKEWLRLAEREKEPDPTLWNTLVELVQHSFRTGELPEETSWSALVILPKGDGSFRGIGLLEAFWKLLGKIIDRRINDSVQFHDALHGFRAHRGCGTAVIEAKLFQQLAKIQQVPVYEVFLDLRKAYDSVDRGRLLEILEGYGVGANALRLLRQFWDSQQIVARQAGYHGKPFTAGRGLVQGDILSPTLFNIICDAVVRYWIAEVLSDDAAMDGLDAAVQSQLALFYADDGMIGSRDGQWLQQSLDLLVELFGRLGLRTNTDKT